MLTAYLHLVHAYYPDRCATLARSFQPSSKHLVEEEYVQQSVVVNCCNTFERIWKYLARSGRTKLEVTAEGSGLAAHL